MTYKTYKKQRYLYFWGAILVYFVPYIVATAALLPFMRVTTGQKVGIGMAVAFLNALPFVSGIFKGFRAHFPLFNMTAFVFVVLASFFVLPLFSNYVYTFTTIELTAALSSFAACVLWGLHVKYKRKAQTVSTVVKSGVLSKDD
ncbi:MAG: hypothetical protein K2L87_01260 [Clostridiales bacterium]|nr:hypothetical protein [Clostridiales bacterium]